MADTGSPQERWGCACPRLDGFDCIAWRSRPPWVESGVDYVEEGERCECHCHDIYEQEIATDDEEAA